MKRRTFLQGTFASGVVGVAASAGLIAPKSVLAAWPEKSFASKKDEGIDGVLSKLYGTTSHKKSGDIKIKAPDIAENGAVVPITISTKIAKAESVSVLIEKNPSPLAAHFELGGHTEGYVSTRVKMGKTSAIYAVVKAGGKLYSSSKTVKVTIGGCGG